MTAELCPRTNEPHRWRDWERVMDWEHDMYWHFGYYGPVPTGDRVRECEDCGRWQIEWADR